MNVYDVCPIIESTNFLIRFVDINDAVDLLKVYSDINSVPFFNSDNCGGDDFYYTTIDRMKEAIEYWIWEYSRKGFVRWSIIDKKTQNIIGTVEIFKRIASDYFNNCALLRLDLRSDYEKTDVIEELLLLLKDKIYSLFECNMIATKGFSDSSERISALLKSGFEKSEKVLIGTHDRKKYNDYYVSFI